MIDHIAGLLDAKWPGWATKIDRDLLNMRAHCILYQIYGGYSDGLIALEINRTIFEYFLCDNEYLPEWRLQIARRL